MKTTIEVPYIHVVQTKDLKWMINGALTQNLNCWIDDYKRELPEGLTDFLCGENHTSAHLILDHGGSVLITEVDNPIPLVLNFDAVERGLKLMADKFPQHFHDFVHENDDAETADVLLQCCLFGDIKYS